MPSKESRQQHLRIFLKKKCYFGLRRPGISLLVIFVHKILDFTTDSHLKFRNERETILRLFQQIVQFRRWYKFSNNIPFPDGIQAFYQEANCRIPHLRETGRLKPASSRFIPRNFPGMPNPSATTVCGLWFWIIQTRDRDCLAKICHSRNIRIHSGFLGIDCTMEEF